MFTVIQIVDGSGATVSGEAAVRGSMSTVVVPDGGLVRVRPDGFQPMEVLVLDVSLEVSGDATVTLVINNNDFTSVRFKLEF